MSFNIYIYIYMCCIQSLYIYNNRNCDCARKARITNHSSCFHLIFGQCITLYVTTIELYVPLASKRLHVACLPACPPRENRQKKEKSKDSEQKMCLKRWSYHSVASCREWYRFRFVVKFMLVPYSCVCVCDTHRIVDWRLPLLREEREQFYGLINLY